jgi:hypothetical protein
LAWLGVKWAVFLFLFSFSFFDLVYACFKFSFGSLGFFAVLPNLSPVEERLLSRYMEEGCIGRKRLISSFVPGLRYSSYYG